MSFPSLHTNRALSLLIAFLVVSAVYLYAFPQANVFYAAVVLLHALGGVVASIWLLFWFARSWRQGTWLVRTGMLGLFLGAIPGLILIYTGALRSEWRLVYVHIAVSFVGAGMIAASSLGDSGWLRGYGAIRVVVVLALIAALAPAARYLRETRWNQHARIENPLLPPLSMNGEGDGPSGPFLDRKSVV